MESKIDYSIMKVGFDDIDGIIDIFRNCFPYSFKWNAPRFLLRKQWTLLLQSGSIEIYIIKIDNEIAAFYELVIDIPLFKDIGKKEKNLLLFLSYPYVAVFHPKCIIPAIKKLIRENKSSNETAGNIDVIKMAWGEYQGVHSKYRGMGLSKIMQRHILNRCVTLGKNIIGCINEPNNVPVVNLHKSVGYIITSENRYGCVFKKELK